MSVDVKKWTKERLNLIAQSFCQGWNKTDGNWKASPAQEKQFLEMCIRLDLAPEARQIVYVHKRGGLVTIDGFRVIAERSKQYAGQIGPFFRDQNKEWTDCYDGRNPYAAKVGVLRHDFKETMWAIAKWDSYGNNGGVWAKMPDLMLAKCAEALALRKAFPNDLGGLYSSEEMEQANDSFPIKEENPKTKTISHKQVAFLEEKIASLKNFNAETFIPWFEHHYKISYTNLGALTVEQYDGLVELIDSKPKR